MSINQHSNRSKTGFISGLLWSILLIFTVLPLHAQIAHYSFDGDLTESLNAYDSSFIVLEVESDPEDLIYIAGVDDQAVELESSQGLKLPVGVTNSLFASNTWAFKMRFKITDWGSENGDRMLINLKRLDSNTPPFFQVKVSKQDDSTGKIVFGIKDGTTAGSGGGIGFSLDQWVEFTVVLDFDTQSFLIYNESYYSSFNIEGFDYDQFKTSLLNSGQLDKLVHIGYYDELSKLHKNDDESISSQYASNLIIDELTVYDAPLPTDTEILESALQQLTNHLEDEITLTESEISSLTAVVLSNFKGNYLTSKPTIDAYFQAYEAAYPPMFIDGAADFYSTYDKFGWVTFNLQLDVFDNYTTQANIDQIEGLAFETSEVFPGPVAESATRLDDQTISINGTYVADPGYNVKTLQLDYGTFARRGTGYYAAPGERITVTVPDELVGIGAEVVIGSHTHDVIGKLNKLKRFPRVISSFEISSNTVEMASPLGGVIYIKIPEGTSLGELDLTISGAVKFAYFAKNSINTGDITDFQNRVTSAEVLWAEVETDNFMFTAPLAFFKRDDIVEALDAWDEMWEAYQLYNGRPSPRHTAEHVVIDTMSKWNVLAGGYPMVLSWSTAPYVDDFWEIGGANMMSILDFDRAIQDDKVTYWHEMSHHNGLATLGNEKECIVGLAYVVTNHLGLDMSIDDAMRYSERDHLDRNDAIVDWVIVDNFINNVEMTSDQRQYQQRGWSKYVDLGVLFGWDSLGDINKVFYDDWVSIDGQTNDPDLNIITDSELILASCETLNGNIAPLYHFWGEHPEDDILDEVNSYPRSEEVYLRLREIRDTVPKTRAEFEPYFNEHAPSSTNNQNYEDYQDAYADWDSVYDPIITQIDYILELYYGSDFDEDGIVFQLDCDDTDPDIGNCLKTITWAPGETNFWAVNGNWTDGTAPLLQNQNYKVIVNGDTSEVVLDTTATIAQLILGNDGTMNTASLKLASGAQLISGIDASGAFNESIIGSNSPASVTIETGATLSCLEDLWIGNESPAEGELLIEGGTMTVEGMFGCGWNGGTGSVRISQYGTLNLSGFDASQSINGTSTIDIESGSLVINGDQTNAIDDYVSAGKITAYHGTGEFVIDYDQTNPGNTTVRARSPYDIWSADLEIGAAHLDDDGDSFNNLYEYALGGDPADAGVHGIAPTFHQENGAAKFRHLQRTNDDNLSYVIQTSDDLSIDNWIEVESPEMETLPYDDENETMIYELPSELDRLFIRLQITYP